MHNTITMYLTIIITIHRRKKQPLNGNINYKHAEFQQGGGGGGGDLGYVMGDHRTVQTARSKGWSAMRNLIHQEFLSGEPKLPKKMPFKMLSDHRSFAPTHQSTANLSSRFV